MKNRTIRYTIESYLGLSYRRKKIDTILEMHRHLYNGIVLDIGGRDRGNFIKPKESVTKWIFADIVESLNPDVVLDIAQMDGIKDASIDVINAIEVFEHVDRPEKGVAECYRALKSDGYLIASTPFLYGIHADPYDYQRWTGEKWKLALKDAGFTKIQVTAMGTGISVTLDMLKSVLRHSNPVIKYLSFFLYPVLDLIEKLDKAKFVQRSVLGKSVGGYFIVAKK